MSTKEYSDNGKLFASRRHLYADKDEQAYLDKNCTGDNIDCGSMPRHRIAGKKTMPPYIEAPVIKVPEPRRQKSSSRGRKVSQTKKEQRPESTQDGLLMDRCYTHEPESSKSIQLPLCVSDAVVMVVPKSYLPTMDPMPYFSDSSSTTTTSKDKKKGSKAVSFSATSPKVDNSEEHVLGKKIAPLYTPRPTHESWSSLSNLENSSNLNTADEYENVDDTPWGRRLSAIKVSRVKRDFDEDSVSLEPPEGTLPVCARCGVVVYLAEDKMAAGRHFHSSCFKCFLCNAALDSVNLHERNQEIYCKSCYIRQFGPKGYDYGPGEGALRME